jgi:hypothetical protein
MSSVPDPHHVGVDPVPACHSDADPACHFDADPDPGCHFDADPDPDPTFHLRIRILASNEGSNLEKVLKLAHI